jgi:hypothetical protein
MAYNGWKNYETWNVALWLDNEQHTYSMTQEWAQECWDDATADRTSTRLESAKIALADRLKDYIEEENPLVREASMYSDLLRAAISEVDWYEMAEHYLDDVETTEEEEEEKVTE